MSRLAPALLLLAAIAAVVSGCRLIATPSPPLVTGSQWRVAAIDGQPVGRVEVILTVLSDSATVSTRCGASVAELTVADRGDGVTFGPFQAPAGGACPPDAEATHAAVTEALEGVGRWQVSDGAVELHGERLIRLEPQRTDT